jgi:hypothetical protein
VFTDALVINSTIGVRRSADNGVLTITGASTNGSAAGAQIDLVGNNFGGTGAGGYLLLQAGQGTASEIRMHTNVSTTANVGVERMVIDTFGLVNVARNLSSGSVFTKDSGNMWVDSNLAVGASGPINVNTAVGIISASGSIYSSGVGGSRVGFLDADGASSGQTYVGLRYDNANNRAELKALSGGTAYRDVYVAPNAFIMFGTHVATALTVTGYVEIKDSAGNVRKLAVVS